jgi:excisionase family DNA binding protein
MVLTVAPEHQAALASAAQVLAGPGGVALLAERGARVELPAELRQVLLAAAEALSGGQRLVVEPEDRYLTTQEAADYLGVSRPTMIRILESGVVAYERPNSHRRVKLADLARHKAERVARRAALDELARSSVELEDHDTGRFVPPR